MQTLWARFLSWTLTGTGTRLSPVFIKFPEAQKHKGSLK